MSDQRPPEPGDELPPTHRAYGDRAEENPYGPPPGPAEQPAYQPYTAPPAYGPPQPTPYGYGVPVRPDHPQAGTAFVLGLVSVVGGFFCWLPLAAGPFAWVTGARARREIDRDPRYGGREKATAGMIMGIVATVLLGLGLLGLVLFVLLIAAGTA